MRFATNLEHRHFFSKNGYIEFEKLISLAECALLASQPPEHDLWRTNPAVKKISLRPQFAEIASTLCLKPTLRIGFDVRFQDQCPSFLTHSLQPLIGLAIVLSGEKAGSGIFFLPTATPTLTDSFLITYCAEKTQYLFTPEDPQTHRLKKLKYIFGEQLKNDTHPILFRT